MIELLNIAMDDWFLGNGTLSLRIPFPSDYPNIWSAREPMKEFADLSAQKIDRDAEKLQPQLHPRVQNNYEVVKSLTAARLVKQH